jgi:PelA/Pel-15E family pectate lyase
MIGVIPATEPGERQVSVNDVTIDLAPFRDSITHWQRNEGRGRKDPRFDPGQIVAIADNMLCYQNSDGGWPKNIDWLAKIDPAEVRRIKGQSILRSTFDNRNTYTQIAFLADVYAHSEQPRFREAVQRGLDHILREQRPTGGWRGWDADAITFNDDVMTGIMHLLLDIVEGRSQYAWLDARRREDVHAALDRAVDATLRCQIVVDGKKTAWCQQHDHTTFKPVRGRTYELPSITAQESTGVVRLLMRMDPPTPEIRDAAAGAVAWFESAKIEGLRIDTIETEPRRFKHHTARFDRVAVADPDAPPIWARFYEIETNRPFFCNRDGTKVYALSDVAHERRSGYGWYGHWPAKLIAVDYPAWRAGR